MTGSDNGRQTWRTLLFSCGMLAVLGLTGCQFDVGGQTLPSPHYLKDDVQYFPSGPQFPLSREAAAQKAYSQEEAARR